MLKKLVVLFSLVCFVSVLTACNTVDGFGKDVEGAGESIQDGAEKNK